MKVSILILLDYLFLYYSDIPIVDMIRVCLNPYFTGLSILIGYDKGLSKNQARSQSLFYWIIYSYLYNNINKLENMIKSQSLFYWIIYSYFILAEKQTNKVKMSQSLFYWIIYSYNLILLDTDGTVKSLNPYFTGLSILISCHI